jgi:hypothetical protein
LNLKFEEDAEINSGKAVLKHTLKLNSSENSITSTEDVPFMSEEIEVKNVYYYNSVADKVTKTAG